MSLWSELSVSPASYDFLFQEDRNPVGIDWTCHHRRLSFLIWSITCLCILFAMGWEKSGFNNK